MNGSYPPIAVVEDLRHQVCICQQSAPEGEYFLQMACPRAAVCTSCLWPLATHSEARQCEQAQGAHTGRPIRCQPHSSPSAADKGHHAALGVFESHCARMYLCKARLRQLLDCAKLGVLSLSLCSDLQPAAVQWRASASTAPALVDGSLSGEPTARWRDLSNLSL